MSNEKTSAATPHVLTSEDLWTLTTYDFEVTKGTGGRPCVFKIRRMDLLTQLMEDVVNAPLLKAAMAIIEEIQAWINENAGHNFQSAFENLTAEKKRTVLEQLRHYACNTVLQPRLANVDHADAGALPSGAFPVSLLSTETLFALWNHTPPDATVPRLSEVAAEAFREAAGDGAGRATPPVAGVRAAAVGVDAGSATAGEP